MSATEAAYVPTPHGRDWQRAAAGDAGFDAIRLAEAVAFAEAHDGYFPRGFHYPHKTKVGEFLQQLAGAVQ